MFEFNGVIWSVGIGHDWGQMSDAWTVELHEIVRDKKNMPVTQYNQ